ncbi:transposase [Sphingobium sp. YR657]|uniref:transposase n=1 Tax=Sphingobium sp. YR657 TaxID=1884366 RepID=UPI0020C843A5|nr:transposase [Sphingobium sp. YR657]
MPCDDAGTSKVQRFEVFTGAGQRRDWPPEVKAAIIAESYSKQETVCAVARRHGLIPRCIDHDPRAHLRRPIVMMRHG